MVSSLRLHSRSSSQFFRLEPSLELSSPVSTSAWLLWSALGPSADLSVSISVPLGDRLGRKKGLIAACVLFCLGIGLQLDTKFAAFVVSPSSFHPSHHVVLAPD